MIKRILEECVPLALINQDAKKEKLAVPPITLLQYYYTRKPLISARLAICGGLLSADTISSPDEINALLGIDISLKKRAYLEIPDTLLKKIQEEYQGKITVLDPFAGSGMIPFEALRLGLDVVAVDYNPVAALVMRGSMEYPIKYGRKTHKKSGESQLYEDVKKYANNIYEKLHTELIQFYPKHEGVTPRTYIHCWAVVCPVCGRLTPIVSYWELDKKRKIGLSYKTKDNELVFDIVKDKELPKGNIERGKATCIYDECDAPIKNEHIVKDISENEHEMLLAIYLENGEFVIPNRKDRQALIDAKKHLKKNLSILSRFMPTEVMLKDVRASRYLTYWHRMFTPRQLLVLTSLAREIRNIVDNLLEKDREYATVIGTYLSMILVKHVTRNSRGGLWDRGARKIGHLFTTRGLSMAWDHPEVNPFIKTSGSLENCIRDILRGLHLVIDFLTHQRDGVEKFREPQSIQIHNSSILSWQTDDKFKLIVTDPPYYDDVPYPEFLHILQVWYNRIIGDLVDIPPTPLTSEELSVGRTRDEETFENRMLLAIKRLYDLLEDDGILVMFYVHKSVSGWKYVIEALRKSGFCVTSTHTLRTESGAGVIVRNKGKKKSSIFHSLLLTARKRKGNETADILDVETEIRKKMEERFAHLQETYGNDRLNLMVAASGIVIETITSYSEITSFSKDIAEYSLEIGQRFLIELFAKNIIKAERVDPKTMLYVWFRHSPIDRIPFSEFNQTLKALGTEESLVADIIMKSKDIDDKVQLLDFADRGVLEIDGADPVTASSEIDAVHMTLRAYMRGGLTAAESTIKSTPFGEQILFKIIKALADIYQTKTDYSEGEICFQFLKDAALIKGISTIIEDFH